MNMLDDRDQAILAKRQAALDKRRGPRVGDWVEFTDGVVRRISYIWPDSIQTSDGGTYYLDLGYVSMSGSLHQGVPAKSLKRTKRTKTGGIWFFHHDFPTADGGVDTTIAFRVYACSLAAHTESGVSLEPQGQKSTLICSWRSISMSMSVSFGGGRASKNSRPIEVGDLVLPYARAHHIGIVRRKIVTPTGAHTVETVEVEWPDGKMSTMHPSRVRLQEDAVREAEHTVSWHMRQRTKAAAHFGVSAAIRRP